MSPRMPLTILRIEQAYHRNIHLCAIILLIVLYVATGNVMIMSIIVAIRNFDCGEIIEILLSYYNIRCYAKSFHGKVI